MHLANGHDALALDDAHVVLDLAHEHGFTLLLVDAVELIAEVATRRDNNLLAARLFGGAHAVRQRLGYVAYIRSKPHAVATTAVEAEALGFRRARRWGGLESVGEGPSRAAPTGQAP